MAIIYIKAILLLIVLTYASYQDIKTRQIPDRVHILLILIGLIKVNLFLSISGLLLLPLPFLIIAIKSTRSMGGGDIKMIASIAFLLGILNGYLAVCLGLLLGVLIEVIKAIIKKQKLKQSFPLAPYLSIGCYFIFLITTH